MEVTLTPAAIHSYTPPEAPKSGYKEIIWNIASAIIFPIGLYRLACYATGKYLVSQAILLSSSYFFPKTPEVELDENSKQVTLRTPDGVDLDAVEITPPGAEKWVVFATGNCGTWQGCYEGLKTPNYNVLAPNYRGTGKSTGRPSCIEDLCSDIDTAVQSLLDKGIDRTDIILSGVSLGCVAALHVANRRGLSAIAQNGFRNTEVMIPHYLKPHLLHFYGSQCYSHKPARWALKDALLSLPHLALRVTYFFFSMLRHLFHGNFEEAKLDLIEIPKTIITDLITTITGLIALIAFPYRERLTTFNGKLNLELLARSALCSLARDILHHTEWNADNISQANALGTKRCFVCHPAADWVIPYEEASLAKALDIPATRELQGHGHTFSTEQVLQRWPDRIWHPSRTPSPALDHACSQQ